MKEPRPPPLYEQQLLEYSKTANSLLKIFGLRIPPDPRGTYYHWDKLRHLKSPPDGLTHEEWWFGVKSARRALYQTLPHKAKDKSPFVFAEPKVVRQLLHEIDLHGGGELKSSAQVTNPSTRDAYLISSLIEEAITSSQLEGAATTRKVAKEMIRQGRSPKDRSERMILNNYQAMEYIGDIADEELTPSLILELHNILTADTLDNPDAVGKFRTTNDVYVGDDRDSTILFRPPTYTEIPKRIDSICKFANESDSKDFLHPVIRAIVLHFLLAYDHPFEDGNGRTARALFYWSMLKQGYWTMEFISISRVLKEGYAKYARSYLYTETDDNDVTYFIVHQLQVIKRAILDLFEYFRTKSKELRDLESLVSKSAVLQKELNHRQIAVLNRALKSPDAEFTTESHRGSHNVTYETARTDLMKLHEIGLLEKSKRRRAFIYRPVKNLRQKLATLDH